MHPRIARREDSFLLIVDIQQPLLRVVREPERLLKNVGILVEVARALDLPILATEQYPERFGPTDESLSARWGEVVPIGKMCFSSCGSDSFRDQLQIMGRKTAILCGVETHVCVNQTAHDLLHDGYSVHIVADAVTSRTEENRQLGLKKMGDSGAVITSTEMVVYELMREAGTPVFKALLPLFR